MDEKKNIQPDAPLLISMLTQMVLIRSFEEALYRAFMTEKMPGTMHQTTGQEAIAVGVGHTLIEGDVMTSTHRGHGHAIAKGVAIPAMMAEMYARSSGVSAGMGGSMHMFDLKHGFLGTTGVVGAGVPIAAGAALALQFEKKQNVAVAFMGDGAVNQGAVHEALNLAAVWKLPLVFVCENNLYAVSMPMKDAFAIDHIAERAPGYGMPGISVDGNDVLAVYQAANKAVDRARKGLGPSFLECNTYRHKGHSRFEPAAYRDQEEHDKWMAKDPILRFSNLLVEQGLMTLEKIESLRQDANKIVSAALDSARAAPPAQVDTALALAFKD